MKHLYDQIFGRFSFRVGFPVLLILILSICGSMFGFHHYFRSQSDKVFHRGLTASAQAIKAALEIGMVKNDRRIIQQVIDEGRKNGLFANATVLDRLGYVKYTSDPAMKKSSFSFSNKECRLCHQTQAEIHNTKAGTNKILVLPPDAATGVRLHRSIEPILAQPRCVGCHVDKVLGFIMVDYDSAPVEAMADTAIRRFAATGIVTLFLACGVFFFFLNCNLNKPLRRLMAGIARVGGGDFDYILPKARPREFAAISSHFNQMAVDLKEHVKEIERKSSRIEELTRLRDEVGQMNQRLNQKVLELYMLHEVGKAVNSTLELDVLFHVIMEMARTSLGITDFCILLYNEEKNILEIKVDYGLPGNVAKEIRFEPGEGVSGRVFSTGEPCVLNNAADDPQFQFYRGAKPNIGSFLCTPLEFKGKILGVLNVDREEPNAFGPEDLELYSALANQIAIAIENARMYEITRRMTYLDSLTGLYNHGFFQSRLREILGAASMKISILMVDIDHFKHVNDRYGHAAGDIVLKEISAIMRECLRNDDIIARYGGEEFGIILPDTNLQHASLIAERIRKKIEANDFRVSDNGNGHVLVTVSIGVCQYEGNTSPEAFIETADRALYEAKILSRNRVVTSMEGHSATI